MSSVSGKYVGARQNIPFEVSHSSRKHHDELRGKININPECMSCGGKQVRTQCIRTTWWGRTTKCHDVEEVIAGVPVLCVGENTRKQIGYYLLLGNWTLHTRSLDESEPSPCQAGVIAGFRAICLCRCNAVHTNRSWCMEVLRGCSGNMGIPVLIPAMEMIWFFNDHESSVKAD